MGGEGREGWGSGEEAVGYGLFAGVKHYFINWSGMALSAGAFNMGCLGDHLLLKRGYTFFFI